MTYDVFSTVSLLWGVVAFLAVVLTIEIINLLTLPVLVNFQHPHPHSLRALADIHPDQWPFVSVLLPARNEERNIGQCLRSLLTQHYLRYEVVMLDDSSEDATGAIATSMCTQYPHLRVIRGKPLPPGWVGKNWACHQLAHSARGQLLLFTDADTRHHPLMLTDAVITMLALDADLLTGMPRQLMLTWGERLTVPMLYWVLFALVPSCVPALAHRLGLKVPVPPSAVGAIGQFMLFRREAYAQAGGHAGVRSCVAEDFALARRIQSLGLTWRLADAGPRIVCRMYEGTGEAVSGFSRSIMGVFSSPLACALAWGWLAWVFIGPPGMLAVQALNLFCGRTIYMAQVQIALLASALAILSWGLLAFRFRLPPLIVLAYPLSVLIFLLITGRALYARWTGQPVVWKGRVLALTDDKVCEGDLIPTDVCGTYAADTNEDMQK